MAATAAQKKEKEAESPADAERRKHYEALREAILKELAQLRPTVPAPPDRSLPPQYIIRAKQPAAGAEHQSGKSLRRRG